VAWFAADHPALDSGDEQGKPPDTAMAASLGRGNPTAVAELRPENGVLTSAPVPGPDSATESTCPTKWPRSPRRGAANAEATAVEFDGRDEDLVPMADGAVGVVISNCVLKLSVDQPAAPGRGRCQAVEVVRLEMT
jgi:arsenite methyltransferase